MDNGLFELILQNSGFSKQPYFFSWVSLPTIFLRPDDRAPTSFNRSIQVEIMIWMPSKLFIEYLCPWLRERRAAWIMIYSELNHASKSCSCIDLTHFVERLRSFGKLIETLINTYHFQGSCWDYLCSINLIVMNEVQ